MASRLAIPLALVALVAAVYAQVRHHDFVNYDDRVYVVRNPMLQQRLGAASLARAFRPYETNWIPLTWISLQLDHAVHGLEPAGYLLTNAALHAASSVLLFLALRRLTGARGPSAFVAAVFAAHPLHVESVAWASERKDALSGLFFAASLLAFARYAERPGALRYGALLLAAALGLAAKPMLVTLPCVLLLLDHWPLGRLARQPLRAVVEKLPLLALSAAAALVTWWVQRSTGAMSGDEFVALGWRVANALDAAGVYVLQTVWPANLAAFYPHPRDGLSAGRVAAAAALVLGASGLALWNAQRRPYLAVGWFWYLGMLVPVSGLVQVGLQARADRYTYLPSIGLSIAVAWLAADLARTARARRALGLAAGAAVLALAGVAWRQVGTWKDTGALFDRALAVTRDNYLAHQAVATLALEDGRAEEAAHHFAEALRIFPDWAGARFGLADALAAKGETQAAFGEFRAGLERAPRHPNGRSRYARALAAAGRHDEAVAQYLRALRTTRGATAARTHALLAASLEAQAEREGALRHYRRAVDLDPSLAEAHARLGALLLRSANPAEAAPSLQRALDLGLDSVELRLALAECARAQGRQREAALHYREALRQEPASVAAANNLAWLLATHPDPGLRDPDEALRLAGLLTRASQEAPLLDTLAAALAAAGRFPAAVEAAERAARRADAAGDRALAAGIRARRDLYAAGRPYREDAGGEDAGP